VVVTSVPFHLGKRAEEPVGAAVKAGLEVG
jgi:hypothetical protein